MKTTIQQEAFEKVINVTKHDTKIIHFKVQGTPQEKVYAGFSPEVTMGSMTKGNKHTVTLFSDEKQILSWDWGLGGHTLVSDKIRDLGKSLLEYFRARYKFNMGGEIYR